MTDPYKVLGISSDASDDEVKKAYRKLSRIYHPDANINNPDKDKAEEKFKQVQQAYDQIQKMRSGEYSTGNAFEGFGGFGYSDGRRKASESDDETRYFNAAVSYIQTGYYEQALNVLKNIENRNAMWYYLSAVANMSAGNNIIGLKHAQTAVQMEPDNAEYRRFLNYVQSGGNWYQERTAPYGGMSLGGDPCVQCCVANTICNCCLGTPFCCC